MAHIASGRAYLYGAVRNIFLQKIRRDRIVNITAVTELDNLRVLDEEPLPERVKAGRLDLQRVQCLVNRLPAQRRRLFRLRRVRGLSQKEIASALRKGENTVETECVRGLKKILRGLEQACGQEPPRVESEQRDRDRARGR